MPQFGHDISNAQIATRRPENIRRRPLVMRFGRKKPVDFFQRGGAIGQK
jgi:hypothetical protein